MALRLYIYNTYIGEYLKGGNESHRQTFIMEGRENLDHKPSPTTEGNKKEERTGKRK